MPTGAPRGIGFPGGSAGSPEIARTSGGDSLGINDATSVETTFERIRRRYAIYFYLPDGMGTEHPLELDLANAARRIHPDASLQYRQVALAKDGARPGLITRVPAHPPSSRPDPELVATEPADDSSTAPARRRRGVSDSTGTPVVLPSPTQPVVDQSTTADQDHPPVTLHRRAISDTGSAPRVSIGPVQ
jgi:hypothetical protein